MIRKIIFTLLCLSLTACDKQPNDVIIKNSLEKKLNTVFDSELFTIEKVIRRGSAIDSKKASDKTRRVVYYDLILKLNKNIDLSTYDQHHEANLMIITGAGSKGITGIKSNGNKVGDLIKIHASSIFIKKNGSWESESLINSNLNIENEKNFKEIKLAS